MYILAHGVEADSLSSEFSDAGTSWIIIPAGTTGDGLLSTKWLIRLLFAIRNWDTSYMINIMVDGLNKKTCLKYSTSRTILFHFMKNCINMKILYYMWLQSGYSELP